MSKKATSKKVKINGKVVEIDLNPMSEPPERWRVVHIVPKKMHGLFIEGSWQGRSWDIEDVDGPKECLGWFTVTDAEASNG